MRAARLAFLAMLFPVTAQAEDYFEKGAVPQLSPDKAYFLIRTTDAEPFEAAPVLVRALSKEELTAAAERHKKDARTKEEPNVVLMDGARPFVKIGNARTTLVAAKPGTYILAANTHSGGSLKSRGTVAVCLCLGSVRFEAKPGVITDMGSYLTVPDDKPSPIAETAREVRGRRIDQSAFTVAVLLRPVSETMPVPESLAALPRAAAEYRAQSPFPNYFGVPVNRLSPIPGVLDYDAEGRVVDLKAAK